MLIAATSANATVGEAIYAAMARSAAHPMRSSSGVPASKEDSDLEHPSFPFLLSPASFKCTTFPKINTTIFFNTIPSLKELSGAANSFSIPAQGITWMDVDKNANLGSNHLFLREEILKLIGLDTDSKYFILSIF
jgi:hypothetical protein